MAGGVTETRVRTESAGAPKVLHVDDDPTFLELTRGILQQQGMEVASESDPQAVPERLGDGTVAAVVSDYEMPEMDGHALFERVRRDHPSLPFVLFTGKDRSDLSMDFETVADVRYVQKRGAGGYDRLVDVVREVLSGHAESPSVPRTDT